MIWSRKYAVLILLSHDTYNASGKINTHKQDYAQRGLIEKLHVVPNQINSRLKFMWAAARSNVTLSLRPTDLSVFLPILNDFCS